MFKNIQFLLAHLPFQEYLDLEPVYCPDSESRQIHKEMNTDDSWWEAED